MDATSKNIKTIKHYRNIPCPDTKYTKIMVKW